METVAKNLVMSLSAVLMIALQPITLIAMIIAPSCSGIAEQAGAYKIVSVVAFVTAYYFLVWRRSSLVAAVSIPTAQIVLGWLFLRYINSMPMGCPQ